MIFFIVEYLDFLLAKTLTPPRPINALSVVSAFIISLKIFEARSNTAVSAGFFAFNHASKDAYDVGNTTLKAKSSNSAHKDPVLSACAIGA
jgi:hypothetical protein